ncbi:MAG: hypothetical protein P4L41_04255 [Flavipsychrobacter sp.]|nr:hypothetical protein [Flavipsychrobacter sp.]
MDIAKYIGLFLLKNHFCYIHGLGNLELKKRSATQDGDTLRGPSYEVVVTQGGSIDDNLANFIATNEFISISKASNALRDFSTDARAQLLEGKDVVISNIGKFQEVNGRITFTTDPNLQYTPYSVPSMRTDRRPDEAAAARPYTPPLPSMQTNAEKPTQSATPPPPPPARATATVDWKKVIVAVVALIVLIVLALVAFKFIQNRNNKAESDLHPHVLVPPPVMVQPKVDSAALIKNADTTRTYNFIIGDEETRKKAEKKVALMVSYGHQGVQMVAQDSSMYLIVMPVKCAPSDTLRVMDSLGRFYGYPGVSIYQ